MADPGGSEISNAQLWTHLQALFGGRLPQPNSSGTSQPNVPPPTPTASPGVDAFFSSGPPHPHTQPGAPITSFPLPPASSQLAPPISRYQSTRSGVPHQIHGLGGAGVTTQNLPASTNAGVPPSSQFHRSSATHANSRGPLPGPSVNTSNANQQRLASSAVHIPRQPALPPRSATAGARRRRRGPALRAPSLPTGPKIEDTFIRDPNQQSGVQAIRLRIKVYPPLQVSNYCHVSAFG